VVQGLNDMMAPPENGRMLKQELGERVTLVEFPNSGHMMLMEEPEKTAAAVVSFLRQIGASGARKP
jgi:pimeloyl-ACP methyl ester carboxylesterase